MSCPPAGRGRETEPPDGEPAVSKTAFVLAGGGTKGAFEAGAIRYLVEEEAITPEVITATSAGSICAVVLAQARTHRELVDRARDLHDDLLAMTDSQLLFGKQPWVAALDGTPFGRAVDGYVTERTRPPIPGQSPPDQSPSDQHPPDQHPPDQSHWPEPIAEPGPREMHRRRGAGRRHRTAGPGPGCGRPIRSCAGTWTPRCGSARPSPT